MKNQIKVLPLYHQIQTTHIPTNLTDFCFTFYLYTMDMNITLSTPTFKTYKLMYFFGAWITKEVIAAENDAEAVFDADQTFADSNLSGWKYGVALFCGNRKIKEYC